MNPSSREEESSVTQESPPIMNTSENTSYTSYKRRWFILATFSGLCSLQFWAWNTYGPIVASIQDAYDWSDSTVAMMANWGTITFVFFVFPLVYLLEWKGLRITMITVAFLVASGTIFRALSNNPKAFLYMAHLGSILNGIAGVTVMSAPPALSAVWFPPHQRTTATCISQISTQIGLGFSYTIGPFLVPESNNKSMDYIQTVQDDIHKYLWIEAGLALSLLVIFLIYFPKEPPTPPSASASIARTNFIDGIKYMVTCKNALLCTFAYGLSGGTFLAWQAVMTINFKPLGVNDTQSGQIGFVICISSAILGVCVAFGTDKLRKHMRKSLIILLSLEAFFFTWLTLICARILPLR